MVTIPGRPFINGWSLKESQIRDLMRARAQKAPYLLEARRRTPYYAVRLQVRISDGLVETYTIPQAGFLGRSIPDVESEQLVLYSHGRQKVLYLDTNGNYWVRVGLEVYVKQRLKDLETRELKALVNHFERSCPEPRY